MKFTNEQLEQSEYCLLKDGTIEPTHLRLSKEEKMEIDEKTDKKPEEDYSDWGDGELRAFDEDENGNTILMHDEWDGSGVCYIGDEVIGLYKTEEEAKEAKEDYGIRQYRKEKYDRIMKQRGLKLFIIKTENQPLFDYDFVIRPDQGFKPGDLAIFLPSKEDSAIRWCDGCPEIPYRIKRAQCEGVADGMVAILVARLVER